MRVFPIVLSAPILQLFPGVCKAQEPMGVQTFGPEHVIQGFYEGIIRWLPGADEVQGGAVRNWREIMAAKTTRA